MHEGGYSIDHKMRFYDPWGRPLPPVATLPRGDPGQLARSHHATSIGPNTCASGEGERLDLELAVEALAAITSRVPR